MLALSSDMQTICATQVELVLTAHPTQALRQSVSWFITLVYHVGYLWDIGIKHIVVIY